MRLTLRTKLFGGVGAIVFLAGLLVFMGIRGIDQEAGEFNRLYSEDIVQTNYALEAGLSYSIAVSALKSFLNNHDPAMKDIFDVNVKSANTSLDKYRDAGDPEEKQMADTESGAIDRSWVDKALIEKGCEFVD